MKNLLFIICLLLFTQCVNTPPAPKLKVFHIQAGSIVSSGASGIALGKIVIDEEDKTVLFAIEGSEQFELQIETKNPPILTDFDSNGDTYALRYKDRKDILVLLSPLKDDKNDKNDMIMVVFSRDDKIEESWYFIGKWDE